MSYSHPPVSRNEKRDKKLRNAERRILATNRRMGRRIKKGARERID